MSVWDELFTLIDRRLFVHVSQQVITSRARGLAWTISSAVFWQLYNLLLALGYLPANLRQEPFSTYAPLFIWGLWCLFDSLVLWIGWQGFKEQEASVLKRRLERR